MKLISVAQLYQFWKLFLIYVVFMSHIFLHKEFKAAQKNIENERQGNLKVKKKNE